MNKASRQQRWWGGVSSVIAVVMAVWLPGFACADSKTSAADAAATGASIDEARETLGKWIETQRLISKERKDWEQGKEILLGRIELVKLEIASLEKKIEQSEAGVVEADKKKAEIIAESDKLKASTEKLVAGVTALEAKVHRLYKAMPEPVQRRLQPLYQRMPEDPAKPNAAPAERYQNVVGILNEMNKVNNEITVDFEVRNLASGKPAEVKTVYIGLAQGYYVSANGEGGISHPNLDGWTWQPDARIGNDVLRVLEIIQGKHTAVFVPLPVKLQ